MIETRRQRENAMNAHTSKRRLETYDAAQSRWNANGTSGIGADCRCTQTGSYGDRGSSARTTRNAVRLPGISYRPIVWVLQSHPIRKLVQVRFAEHNSACTTQFPNHGGVFRRNKIAQNERAHRRKEILRINVIFQRDRDAVKHSSPPSSDQLPFGSPRFRKGTLRGHRYKRIQLWIEPLDARQIEPR